MCIEHDDIYTVIGSLQEKLFPLFFSRINGVYIHHQRILNAITGKLSRSTTYEGMEKRSSLHYSEKLFVVLPIFTENRFLLHPKIELLFTDNHQQQQASNTTRFGLNYSHRDDPHKKRRAYYCIYLGKKAILSDGWK